MWSACDPFPQKRGCSCLACARGQSPACSAMCEFSSLRTTSGHAFNRCSMINVLSTPPLPPLHTVISS